ncbi:MAG: hypothetical protein FWD67_10280 [Betaproteobacteria bacterium]|nr:hypothetical protein [Betaproteobacteria bacterium]
MPPLTGTFEAQIKTDAIHFIHHANRTPHLRHVGYLEFAGWVPDNKQMLVAREIVANGQSKTSFELWDRNTLAVERHADKPGNLTPFHRWQDPTWTSRTVTVR